MVIFLSPPEDAFDQFLENLNIVIEPLPPQMTLQEYVKICVQQMSQTPLQLQENGPATIAQREAYRCVYTGPLPNQTAGEWMQYLIVANSKGYVVTYTAQLEKFDKFLPLIEQMVSSLEIQ